MAAASGVAALAAAVIAVGATARTAAGPANTSPPTLTGTAQQGSTLQVTTGTWSPSTGLSFRYQWQHCDAAGAACVDVAGATASTFTLAAADVGGRVRALVTATDTSGASGSAASSPSDVVAAPDSAPHLTAQPNPHGAAQVGQTLTVDNGTWAGTTPMSFSYQWQRCTAAGASCAAIAGATATAYAVTLADLGSRLRALVTAKNAAGAATAASNLSDTVAAAAGAPANTARPAVGAAAGTVVGAVLAGTAGTWTGNQPLTYSYAWTRCDANGASCQAIAGATTTSYTLTAADAGHRLAFAVTAANTAGHTTATSVPTPAVTTGPPGAIKLADGLTSIPATSVALPDRLVISGVSFSPSRLSSRAPFTGRFHVTDGKGYAVRGALVYAIALPYGRVTDAPEATTGDDGWATIQFTPTAKLPLQRGAAIVMFLRARKVGDTILAGVSTRRLIQIRIG